MTRSSVMELGRMPHHHLHVVERELPMADILDMIRWLKENFLGYKWSIKHSSGGGNCLRCLQQGLQLALSRSAFFSCSSTSQSDSQIYRVSVQCLQVGSLLYKGEMVKVPTPTKVTFSQ